MVYNMAAAGSGTTAVVTGVYIYNGTNWVHSAMNAPVITTQPAKFTFKRLKDDDGDPNGPAVAGTALTVAAANATSYQWYRVSNNNYTADVSLGTTNGANTASYTFTPAGTGKANWGLSKFYCIISNNSGSVKSEIAEVAYGCGAKTNDNRWLRFMCHNLGAAPVTGAQALDAVTVGYTGTGVDADTLSTDAKGWWFQWGRQADGHQWRNTNTTSNPTYDGPIDLGSTTYTIPSGHAAYGKFIINTDRATAYDWLYPQFDQLWRNWNDNRFPCPSGWRVPSSSEWGTIYRGSGHYGTPGDAVPNVWAWSDAPRGYKIQPDGSTVTLFLPAAGLRGDVTVGLVGTYGNYWSSTVAAGGAYYVGFYSSGVTPEASDARGHGRSVRCLAE
jgi:uncharacterized protein (TIGR02145 family)